MSCIWDGESFILIKICGFVLDPSRKGAAIAPPQEQLQAQEKIIAGMISLLDTSIISFIEVKIRINDPSKIWPIPPPEYTKCFFYTE